jgi:hypothetical protein
VTRPEDAVEQARRAADEARGRGAYRERGGEALEAFEHDLGAERPSDELMQEWAVVRVDKELLYSTRRFGGPLTAFKRGLLRLLRQYTNELEAQQSRFNFAVLGRLRELEERVARQNPRERD